jgi:hypothetical protein
LGVVAFLIAHVREDSRCRQKRRQRAAAKMPSPRSKAIASLRRALKIRNVENTTFRELYHFNSAGSEQTNSDRAAALIVGTILEESLEIAISTHFVGWKDVSETNREIQRDQLFGYGSYELSPLSSFASRIRLGFALGIYGPKMRDDLDSIKNIRNLFAHFKGPATFEHDEIRLLCEEMNSLGKMPQGGLLGLLFGKFPDTPKDKFVRLSQLICLYLISGARNTPLFYKDSMWEDFAS